VVDEAEAVLYGTVPLTEEVIKNMIDNYIPLVDLDYICSVKDEAGRIVAFGVMVPSLAKAFKKAHGRMLPLGIVHMLRALKGKEFVRRNFLMPRLLRDWLVLFNTLLGNDTAGAELAVAGASRG
jgi:hypothetical protein